MLEGLATIAAMIGVGLACITICAITFLFLYDLTDRD